MTPGFWLTPGNGSVGCFDCTEPDPRSCHNSSCTIGQRASCIGIRVFEDGVRATPSSCVAQVRGALRFECALGRESARGQIPNSEMEHDNICFQTADYLQTAGHPRKGLSHCQVHTGDNIVDNGNGDIGFVLVLHIRDSVGVFGRAGYSAEHRDSVR